MGQEKTLPCDRAATVAAVVMCRFGTALQALVHFITCKQTEITSICA